MSENRVQRGKFVEVTYTIVDEHGEVVEAASLPIHYVHGYNSGIFPEIERALDGKSVGDTVSVEVKDGFGPHDPNLTFTDAVDNVPHEFRKVGAEVEMQSESGEVKTFHVKVAGVRDASDVEKQQAYTARDQNPVGGGVH